MRAVKRHHDAPFGHEDRSIVGRCIQVSNQDRDRASGESSPHDATMHEATERPPSMRATGHRVSSIETDGGGNAIRKQSVYQLVHGAWLRVVRTPARGSSRWV